jgi:hypothetical protein
MKKKYIVLFIVFIALYLFLGFIVKYKVKNIKRNEVYTIGEVLKISHVQGNRTADFKYFLEGTIYNGSSFYFSDNISQVGTKYFVIVNKKNIEQAYILGCCPYDENIHFVPSNGLDKIPDEDLQKKADEAFEEILNSPLSRLLPPY